MEVQQPRQPAKKKSSRSRASAATPTVAPPQPSAPSDVQPSPITPKEQADNYNKGTPPSSLPNGLASEDEQESETFDVVAPPAHAGSQQTNVVDPAKLERLSKKLHDYLQGCSNLRQKKAVLYSVAEETAHLLGLSQYSNQLIVVGMQSAGKTSIFEALLLLPLGFTRVGTATMCAVIYRIRRNTELDEPLCSYRWLGQEHANLTITERNAHIGTIMLGLQKIDTEHELEVTIEDPHVTTLTLIDIPGAISPKNIERPPTDGAPQRIVERKAINSLIAKYLGKPGTAVDAAHTTSSARKPIQRILWVKRANLDASDDSLTLDFFLTVDPTSERTVVAATMADLLPQKCQTGNLDEQLQQAWVDPTKEAIQPWFLALHSISTADKERGPWQAVQREGPNRSIYKKRWGWSNFQRYLQGQINRDFIDNAQLLFGELLKKAAELEKEQRTLEQSVCSSLAKRSGVDVALDFIYKFKETLFSLQDQLALSPAFLNKHGRTMNQELSTSRDFLESRGIAPVPDSDVYHGEVPNAYLKAFNMARAVRINCDNLARLDAIKPPSFTADQVLAATPFGKKVNLHDPARAVPLLLTQALKERVLPFVPFAVWRMAFCLWDSFDAAIELMKSMPQWSVAAHNELFVGELRSAFNEWLEGRARRCEKQLTEYHTSKWRYHNWNLAQLLAEALSTPTGKELSDSSNRGISEEVRGKITNSLESPNSLNLEQGDYVTLIHHVLNSQFYVHKMRLSEDIQSIVTGEIMQAADPSIDAKEEFEDRLEVFLKAKLTSTSVHGSNDDPYGICQGAHRAASQASKYGRQAAAIRKLHHELSTHLLQLRGKADELSIHGGDDDHAPDYDDDDEETMEK